MEGFTSESRVEFADLILAGEHGMKIPVTASSFTISAETLIPTETKLQTCYPNPFNPVTTINYDLAVDGQVEIRIYDLMGRVVTDLVSETQQVGRYEVNWNANGHSSGAYFLKMATPDYTSTQKLMLVN